MSAKQIEMRAHLQALLKEFGAREIADQDVCVFVAVLFNTVLFNMSLGPSYSTLFAWLTGIVNLKLYILF